MIAWILIALIISAEFAALFAMFIYQWLESLKNKDKELIGVCICEAIIFIILIIAIIGFIGSILTEYHSSF